MNRQLLPELDVLVQGAQTFVRSYLEAALTNPEQLTGWSLEDRDPRVIEALLPFFGWFYRHYFHVRADGWEHLPPAGKMLLIGSHNGGLAAPDTVMLAYEWFHRFGPERAAYALMDPRIWRVLPGLARLATQVGTLRPHPHMAIKALRREAAVLIYPGGVRDVFRPYALRHKIHFHHQRGFIKLALQESAPIVPLISHGAHATLVVLADLYSQMQQLHRWGMPWPLGVDPEVWPLYLGLPWGLAFGPLPNFPLPVPLHIRICPPILFEHYGRQVLHNQAYVTACYDRVCQEMQQALDRLVQEVEAERGC
jgi:1-acyl-sn-glycerol-3-phosphate acyltransferase